MESSAEMCYSIGTPMIEVHVKYEYSPFGEERPYETLSLTPGTSLDEIVAILLRKFKVHDKHPGDELHEADYTLVV